MTIGSQRERTLLAQIALEPGRATSSEALQDGVWGADLPANPSGALQTLVTRLRKRFADDEPSPIAATPGGYVLRLDPDAVDLARFHRSVTVAVEAPDPTSVIGPARAALELWSEPFAGCVLGEHLAAERVRAEERMLRAVESLARAHLDLDEPAPAADVLVGHLPAHRDREGLVALAMTALHRSGRTAEALAAFAETRRCLRVEYGVDPGPGLREIERGLLAGPAPAAPHRRPVVGREDLLAVIRTHLDDTTAGRIVLIDGEAGIGKTTLMRAARDEVRRRGGIAGAGVWDGDGSPLAAWVEGLAGLGLALSAPGDQDTGRVVRRLLATRAADAPVLLTLDDAHRADSASRGALLALARLGVPAGVAVVVATRAPDAIDHPGWDDTHADLVRHPSVVEQPVAELDRAGAAAMVDGRLREVAAFDAPTRHRLGELLWERAAGHPLHLDALLDEIGRCDDEQTARALTAQVPARLRAVLAHQLERLPAGCRTVVEALAVLAPVDVDGLAELLDTDARGVASAMRPAVDLALVEPTPSGYAFRHELTAFAARGRVPPPEQAVLHRARFHRLDADAPPFERLRHAVGAAELLAAATVADARVVAGRAAHAGGALEEALAHLDRARPDASDPAATDVARGLVLEALGRGEESDDALDAVAADPGTAVEHAVDAAVGADAMGISVAGRPRRLARLERVRARELTDHQRVRVLRGLVVEQEQLHGGAEEDALPELLDLAARVDDPRLRAQVELLRANRLADEPVPIGERIGVCEQAHGLAVRTGEPVLRMEAEELLVAALLAGGRVEDARAIGDRLGPEAERRRHARSIWACAMVESSLLLARGETDRAGAAAEAAMRRGVEMGIPDAVGGYGVHLTVQHLLSGSLPQLGGLPATAASMYPHVAAWPAGAAVDAIQAGDVETAERNLAEFHRRRDGRPHRMFDRPGLCLAATALFGLGDRETAHVVLEGLPPDPEAVVVVGVGAGILGPVALYQGLCLLTLGEDEAARSAFKAAVELAGRLEWGPWVDAATRLGLLAQEPTGPGVVHAPLPLGLPTPP